MTFFYAGTETGHRWEKVRPYSFWVLLLLLLAYLFNQLDRYMLAITISDVAQELKFGDKGCMKNKSVSAIGSAVKCNASTAE